jgi:hypothetical protein
MNSELAKRRQWFDQYYSDASGAATSAEAGRKFCCPCCGYPTLPERAGDDICDLCDWQDNGQDDPHAGEVTGGPNNQYSLTQARENFKRSLIMYDPDGEFCIVPGHTQAEIDAKKAMIAAFEAIRANGGKDSDALHAEIERSRRVLGAEAVKKMRQYERSI